MPKAFLSHSSNDKEVVKRVFDNLGAAGTHYDEATFEAGERTASEIYSALLDTDLFVLFVSPASIDSPWVQTELALAQQKLFSRHIKQVVVFLLRDISPARLPEWLRDHVYQKLSSPTLIAKVIRSKLLEMAVETGTQSQIFLGRDKALAPLKAALARISTDSPDVIFLAGTDGIGRRSLANKALQETYPGLPKFPIEIVLSGYQGEVDFYKELLASTEIHTIAELLDLVRAFTDAVPIERATLISDLLGSITKQKQVVFLRGHESVVKDDGNLQDWIAMLIRQLPKRARPQLVVIARRMIPAPKRSSYTNVYFGSVQSLSRDYSKDVLSLWLKEMEADFPPELVEDIIDYVVGHPKNIEIAARYAAEVGVARINADRREFLDMIRQRASALIETISLNEDQKKFLALFREYEYLSADDMLTASDGGDKTIQASIGYLQEHGILERDGRYLRLAPYLSDAVSRHKWNDIPIKTFIESAQKRFLDRVKTLRTDDFVEISTVDHAILAALRTGKGFGNPLISRALLPSHMLHVAREFYNVQNFERAAELCQQALGRSYLLTRDAQIEALRVRALALARRGKTEAFYKTVEQLEQYGERVAKRNAKFLRGFKLRWEGKPDQAEQFYREAYRLGGDRSFHVLRELAQVLASRGEFVEAEIHSRAAHRIAHRNSYVIDNLLEILIERNKDTLSSLSDNEEIKELFALLRETAKLEERSFYESRMAHFYWVLKSPVEALRWANRAVEVTPTLIPVHLTRVRALLAAGSIPEAEEKVRQLQRMLEDVEPIGDKRYGFEVDQLRAQIAIEKGRYPQARTIIDQSADMPAKVKQALRRGLAQAVIFSGGVDTGMIQWANQVLARAN